MILEKVIHITEIPVHQPARQRGPGYDICIVLTTVGAAKGQLYAFPNRCPHTGARLNDGRVRRNVLTCTHHLAQFDLCTGAVLTYPIEGLNREATGVLEIYDADVDEEGWIRVDTGDADPSRRRR